VQSHLSQPRHSIHSAAQGGLSRVSALAAIGMGVASLAISAAPVRAIQTTVDFSSATQVSN